MKVRFFICLILSVLGGVFPLSPLQGEVTTHSQRVVPGRQLKLGFNELEIRAVKNVLGQFLLERGEASGWGGYDFPGIHSRQEVLGEMLSNDRRENKSLAPRVEFRRTGDQVVQMAVGLEDKEECQRFLELLKAEYPESKEWELAKGGSGEILKSRRVSDELARLLGKKWP